MMEDINPNHQESRDWSKVDWTYFLFLFLLSFSFWFQLMRSLTTQSQVALYLRGVYFRHGVKIRPSTSTQMTGLGDPQTSRRPDFKTILSRPRTPNTSRKRQTGWQGEISDNEFPELLSWSFPTEGLPQSRDFWKTFAKLPSGVRDLHFTLHPHTECCSCVHSRKCEWCLNCLHICPSFC